MLYGGIAQWVTGLVEIISGNTFGATVFCSYGAFNMTYAALYLPGESRSGCFRHAMVVN